MANDLISAANARANINATGANIAPQGVNAATAGVNAGAQRAAVGAQGLDNAVSLNAANVGNANALSAFIAGLLARINSLPLRLIAFAAAALSIGLALFAVYREGRHAAEQAAAVSLAKHNAEIAAKYMRDAHAAEDAAARERARAEDLMKQVTALKEQVAHVAKGNASPGVDAAVRGLRGRTAP